MSPVGRVDCVGSWNRLKECNRLEDVVSGGSRTRERPIEVGDVAEAAVERDIEHLPGLGQQPCGRFTQARASHILMRRETGETFKRTKEIVRAETRFFRQRTER